jgi:hypothetical protein
MKKVTCEQETAILETLQKDIASMPEIASELNTVAAGKIYQAEKCVCCDTMVSMLTNNGLCGACDYTKRD